MQRIAAAGIAALVVATAAPPAHAQMRMEPSGRFTAADWNTLTDMRIDLVKNVLQLTPEQTKYWPAIEDAIRARAKDRQARIEEMAETTGARAQETPMEVLRNRDPISFLNRRADALAQRSADLKKLASAWQPLYATLSPEQKRRMAAVSVLVLRDMTNAIEQRRMQVEDDD